MERASCFLRHDVAHGRSRCFSRYRNRKREKRPAAKNPLPERASRSHVPERTSALWGRRRVSEQERQADESRREEGETRGLSLPRRTTRR